MSERILATTLSETDIEKDVLLKGWVQKRRDLGGLIFIDLRDKSGIIQVVFNPDYSSEALAVADKARSEYVIEVRRKVLKREEGTNNPSMKTGEIEVIASVIDILNKAKTPPFLNENHSDVSEDLRHKYRYMDLRRSELQET